MTSKVLHALPFALVLALAGTWAFAAPAPPPAGAVELLRLTPTPGGGQAYSLTLQALGLITLLTLLPAIVLSMTAFTRIVIVLCLLRQAMGTAQTPPNQMELANLREDVRGLTQRVGDLMLRVEQLERDNTNLRTQNAALTRRPRLQWHDAPLLLWRALRMKSRLR